MADRGLRFRHRDNVVDSIEEETTSMGEAKADLVDTSR